MADKILPVPLNQGLDLVTPPLLAAEGALIDCLNYELTDIAGYRRIDGYERYDGYPNGDINEYFRMTFTADVPAEQSLIVPGSIIRRVGDDVTLDIGVIVGGAFPTNQYDFVTFGSIDNFAPPASRDLLLEDGGSILLESGTGVLTLEGSEIALDTIQIITPSGVTVVVTLGTTIVSGRTTVDTLTFLQNMRVYSAVLRSLVTRAPGVIAGLYWFEDRLLAAIDQLRINVNVLAASTQPVNGVRLRWNGTIYRLTHADLVTPGVTNEYQFYMYPIATSATVNDDLIQVDTADVSGTTWLATVTTNGNPTFDHTKCAAVGYFNNTTTSSTRGFTYLKAATSFDFDTGTYTGTLPNPPTTIGDEAIPDDIYYAVNGANVLQLRMTKIVKEDGNWTLATAEGGAQAVVLGTVGGTRDHLIVGDVIHNEYPVTGSSEVMTISSAPTVACVAGTGALEEHGTRYQWEIYNFYGQASTLSAFGATGAGKAFWANEHGFGTIDTGSGDNDKPKYLAFHVGKLALGFGRGSVMLSVVGEPYNFQGFDGAIEIATGDDLTGLLELPGETLACFGKRGIRKITGFTDVDTSLGSIAAKSSCFDYTAVLVGQDVLYCGVHGISSLSQSAAYGDFRGERVSDPISNWLRPKIVGTLANVESGGVAMAYPVRSKGQYRLVLNTGEVVVVTATANGYKVMFSDYGTGGVTRIPFAWSSALDNSGQEKLHVRWDDADLEDLAYSLDRGWGFDGSYFNHYFDLAHMFNNAGSAFMGVEKVRLHGQGYGVATLNVKSSGVENDFDQDYHNAIQDISMPSTPYTFYDRMKPVTAIVDQANWGSGIKLRISNTTAEGSPDTEPSHMCQVLVLHLRTEGIGDN